MPQFDTLYEALKTLTKLNEGESQIIDLTKIGKLTNISDTQMANYGDITGFKDMLGINPEGMPRILANYKNTSADADYNGTHICFTSDLYNEPRAMPALNFGFIFNTNNLNNIADKQGWTNLISYDDLLTRMSSKKDFERSGKLLPDTKPNKKTYLDYKGNEYQTAPVNGIRLKALIKIEKNNEFKYYLQLYKYSWREIDSVTYDWIKNKIINLPDEYKNQKDLSILPNGPFYVNAEDKAKNLKSIYQSLSEKGIKTNGLIEGFIFGTLSDVDDDIDKNFDSKINIAKERKDYGSRLTIGKKIDTSDTLYINKENEVDNIFLNNLITIFNENEYRIYRKNPNERFDLKRRYLNFKYSDIENIALPEIYKDKGVNIDLKKLWDYWNENNLNESYKGHISKISFNDSNIIWWENPNPEKGADKFNALTKISNNLTRVRGCAMVFRKNENDKYQVCVIVNDNNTFDMPGGGLDKEDNYDTLNTAIRESKEEAGLTLSNISYFGSYMTSFTSNWVLKNVPEEMQWKHYYNDLYIADLVDQSTTNVDENYQWFDLDIALNNKLFRQNKIWIDAINWFISNNEIEITNKPVQKDDLKIIKNVLNKDSLSKNEIDAINDLKEIYLKIKKDYNNKIIWYDKY